MAVRDIQNILSGFDVLSILGILGILGILFVYRGIRKSQYSRNSDKRYLCMLVLQWFVLTREKWHIASNKHRAKENEAH